MLSPAGVRPFTLLARFELSCIWAVRLIGKADQFESIDRLNRSTGE